MNSISFKYVEFNFINHELWLYYPCGKIIILRIILQWVLCYLTVCCVLSCNKVFRNCWFASGILYIYLWQTFRTNHLIWQYHSLNSFIIFINNVRKIFYSLSINPRKKSITYLIITLTNPSRFKDSILKYQIILQNPLLDIFSLR